MNKRKLKDKKERRNKMKAESVEVVRERERERELYSRERIISQKGITIVTLAITIIILIILSTVTINVVLGDNGLIEQVKKTKNIAEGSIENETEDLNESEKDSIKYYNQGEALFICGSRRMRVTIIVTQEELDSFGSGGGL